MNTVPEEGGQELPPPVSSVDKHACPACGAQAVWNPTKQKLVCPFCGTESPYRYDQDSGQVVEHDLVAALRALPEDERGWLDARRSVQCQSCRAVMVFEAERVGQNCEFCGAPALVGYEEIKAPIRPHAVLPFRIDAGRVRETVRAWWRKKWFAPGSLARTSLVDTLRSLYLPYWTFDAQVHCPWTAEAGHYYYVTVSGTDSKGRPTTRQERRTRWEPAAGAIDHFFDDEAVPGTHGVDLGLLRQVEPFPTGEAVPYDTAYLSGHVVEHYKVVLLEASEKSQEQMHARLESLCASQVPGDTHRNLRIAPQYSGRTFKHVLVPAWLLTYRHGAKHYQVIANGCTGAIAGQYPVSWMKVALAILLAVLAALAFIGVASWLDA